MSVIGTAIASGVAQTAYQANDVAARRKKQERERDRQSTRINDLFEKHVMALDEGDDDDTPTRLYIDRELPQHQSPLPLENRRQSAPPPPPPSQELSQDISQALSSRVTSSQASVLSGDESAGAALEGSKKTSCGSSTPLYCHLDVQA